MVSEDFFQLKTNGGYVNDLPGDLDGSLKEKEGNGEMTEPEYLDEEVGRIQNKLRL